MKRLRPFLFGASILAFGLPSIASASFVGPSMQPPYGNVAGVVWNRSALNAADAQPGADFNVAGRGRVGDDFFLSDSKAIHIDNDAPTWLNLGNWGISGGPQKTTLNVIGEIRTDNSYGGTADIVSADGVTANTQVTSPRYCIGADCITAWPSGGGGGAVTTVVAATGTSGGGTGGSVTIGLDSAHADGSAYDSRFVLKSGDGMSGFLISPSFRTNSFRLTSAYGFMQSYDFINPVNSALFEMSDNTGGRDIRYIRNNNTAMDVSIDRSLAPSATGASFRSNSGLVENQFSVAVPNGAASVIADYPYGTQRVGGYLGYCTETANGYCSGFDMTANGTNGTSYGIYIQHTSGTNVWIGNGKEGIRTTANTVGIDTTGGTFGVDAYVSNPAGTAVRGSNGSYGGDFSGSTVGVHGIAGTNGGYFQNSTNPSYYAMLAGSTYGAYIVAPAGGVGLNVNIPAGSIGLQTSGDLEVTGNTWGSSVSADYATKFGGSYTNLPGNNKCATLPITPAATLLCGNGSYLAGVKTNGAGNATDIVCCEL